jgi:hypothetical protein
VANHPSWSTSPFLLSHRVVQVQPEPGIGCRVAIKMASRNTLVNFQAQFQSKSERLLGGIDKIADPIVQHKIYTHYPD